MLDMKDTMKLEPNKNDLKKCRVWKEISCNMMRVLGASTTSQVGIF